MRNERRTRRVGEANFCFEFASDLAGFRIDQAQGWPVGRAFVLPLHRSGARDLRQQLRAEKGWADHLSDVSCSTAKLDKTFCWAGVIGGVASVVLVDVLLLAGTLVLRATNSNILPRCQ